MTKIRKIITVKLLPPICKTVHIEHGDTVVITFTFLSKFATGKPMTTPYELRRFSEKPQTARTVQIHLGAH
jgi:hypothetical protein